MIKNDFFSLKSCSVRFCVPLLMKKKKSITFSILTILSKKEMTLSEILMKHTTICLLTAFFFSPFEYNKCKEED